MLTLPKACALAALAGVLYFSGFAGIDIWPLAFVCLIPLFVLLDRSQLSAKQAFWIGMLFGSVTNWGGYYWLIGMLESFAGMPWIGCVGLALLICFYQGGQLGLFFWLLWRLGRGGLDRLAIAAPVYAATEFAYPLLFPSYFANCLHELPLLEQIADLGGPSLISALMVAINASLYAAWLGLRGGRPWRRGLLLGTAAALAFTLGYGAYRIAQVDAVVAKADKLRVGLVQANMGIIEKRQDPEKGLRRHQEQSRFLEERHHPDLLIWPESANAYVIPSDQPEAPEVLDGLHTPLLFGGLATRQERGGRRIYNTAFMMDENARITSTVDKTYLLAFGEYLPFGETFPVLYDWSPHSSRFSAGTHMRPMMVGPHRITTLICYEDVLPAFVRAAMNEGDSHLLVNITNDAWFGDTTEPWIHLALAKLRAVEHHRYLVRATNSGVSAIIDPVGRVVTHTGTFERASFAADVALLDGTTVYRVVGDWPGWISALLVALLLWRTRSQDSGSILVRERARPERPPEE
jgi:apolipoprotein N-acyltransferase